MSNPRRVKSPPIIYISNPLRASAWKKGVNMIVVSIEKYRQGGAGIMSEENKNFFIESVTSVATLWCNRAISSDDLFRIIRKTVEETEKRIKIDPEAWAI